jgi:hypothetical protein
MVPLITSIDVINGTIPYSDICENYLEVDRSPQTFILIEGSKSSIELTFDFWLRTTIKDGTSARRIVPPSYDWAVWFMHQLFRVMPKSWPIYTEENGPIIAPKRILKRFS